ncbi:MAG: hypothetical protein WCD38_13380, partial [Candidatus Tumulicola sp.]
PYLEAFETSESVTVDGYAYLQDNPAPPPSRQAVARPRSSGGGGGGGRGFFAPLPASPPPDPFAVNADAQRCSGDAMTKAQTLSSELKAYVARIEAAKTAAGYPSSMSAPVVTGAAVTYHGLGTTYALTIIVKGAAGLRSVAGCLPLHIARSDDLTTRHLYAPSSTLFFVPQLTFMPSVGLYFVARQQQAGQESFRIYALPSAAPKTPFEVRAIGALCTSDAHGVATQALAELQHHFANGSATPNWTITPHLATAGTWYELDPADPSVVPALLQCGRLAGATADDIKARGFDAMPVPELNYAVPLGLYLVRPAPGSRRGGAGPSPSPSPAP